MLRVIALSTIVLSYPCVAGADSVTTLFEYDSQVWNGGVMFFDVNVSDPNGITVTGFDSNVLAEPGFNVFLSVLTAQGTHVGNEQNPAVWSPQGIGTGVAAGPNNPSFVDSPDFDLAPGTHGLMLILSHEDPNSADGQAYTEGPLGPYTNGDVTLTLGAASNFPFGPPTSPSIWNGTMYYVPEPTGVLLLALGTLGLGRRH
jgi:hypothetical protein